MTKRKSPEEKASRWPTSKKRVAFSAPKDAATKALIKQNATTSPLLQLPLEIRNKIWSEVLGDHLIHLKYFLNWSPELQESYGSAWRHAVCVDDCPENQEDEKLTTKKGETFSLRSHHTCESDLHYAPIKPDEIYTEWCYFGRETMRLSVLRSCRQIYVEANNILWTTNTFSFADATTLKRFMMTRTINQKRSIKIVRLQMELEFYGYKEWNSVLNMALVRSLSGLRRLRLRIEHPMGAKGYEYCKNNKLLYRSTYCDGLHKVSTLPLTEVEIAVRNPQFMSEHDRWTKANREDFAEGLRKILLNPKGAQIYADDQLKWKDISRKQKTKRV